jgi:hypothetical protein
VSAVTECCIAPPTNFHACKVRIFLSLTVAVFPATPGSCGAMKQSLFFFSVEVSLVVFYFTHFNARFFITLVEDFAPHGNLIFSVTIDASFVGVGTKCY